MFSTCPDDRNQTQKKEFEEWGYVLLWIKSIFWRHKLSFIHDFWGAFDFGLFLYECLTYETNMSEYLPRYWTSKHDALFLQNKWYPSGIENESRLVGKIVITNWTQTTKWCQPVYQSLTTSYHNQYCGNSIDFWAVQGGFWYYFQSLHIKINLEWILLCNTFYKNWRNVILQKKN